MPPGGCGHITMIVPIWLWVDLHRSRNWPWLHNVSTSYSLAKGEDYLGSVGRLHAAKARTPLVKGRLTKATGPAKFLDGHACVSLFEEADDLLIGKSGLFHGRYSPKLADFVPLLWYGRQGAGHMKDLLFNANSLRCGQRGRTISPNAFRRHRPCRCLLAWERQSHVQPGDTTQCGT